MWVVIDVDLVDVTVYVWVRIVLAMCDLSEYTVEFVLHCFIII